MNIIWRSPTLEKYLGNHSGKTIAFAILGLLIFFSYVIGGLINEAEDLPREYMRVQGQTLRHTYPNKCVYGVAHYTYELALDVEGNRIPCEVFTARPSTVVIGE